MLNAPRRPMYLTFLHHTVQYRSYLLVVSVVDIQILEWPTNSSEVSKAF